MNRLTRPSIFIPIYAFILSRLTCALFAYVGHLDYQHLSVQTGKWVGVKNWWINPWTLYDSEHYLSLARDGYQQATAAFFPLYPALLRLGGETTNGQAAAGVLLSNVAFLLALIVLYRLVCLDCDARTARTAVWLLAFFPVTAFFSAVYTESLFLLLTLLAFYGARKGRWKFAGLFGLGAALTRNSGIVISAALLFEYLDDMRVGKERLRALPLLAAALPLCGFTVVQLYLWRLFDTPLPSVAAQAAFYRASGLPWEAVFGDLLGFFTSLNYSLVTFVNLLVIFSCLGLAFRYRRILRPSYVVLMLGLLLMNLCYYVRIPPYTTGTARYLAVAFPYFLLLALLAQEPFVRRHALAATGTGLYVCVLFSYLFGRKIFLG